MSEWRTIESAPRDGTPVDLWVVTTRTGQPSKAERHADCQWRQDAMTITYSNNTSVKQVTEGWSQFETVDYDWEAWGAIERELPGLAGGRIIISATHWMPLPEPPL